MKYITVFVGLLVVVAMLSGCARLDNSIGTGRFDHLYDGGSGNPNDHSHH